MSSARESLLGSFSTPTLLVLAAVLFAGLARTSRYRSPRPEGVRDPRGAYARGDEGFLTEDPLEVVARGEDTHGAPDALPQHCRDGRCRLDGPDGLRAGLAAATGDARLLVLFQHLRASGMSDDHERRIRSRQATLAALLEGGYQPESDHALAHFHAPGARAIPYEWFRPSDASREHAPRYARVLVVWLAEDDDQGQPLQHLLDLVQVLVPGASPEAGAPPGLELRVVGPTSTGELLELVAELRERTASSGSPGSFLRVLSPYATAAQRFSDDLERCAGGPIEVRRTIGADANLARTLVAELAERLPELMPFGVGDGPRPPLASSVRFLPMGLGPRPDAGPVNVAILTEANSPYGRAWVEGLEAARQSLLRDNPRLGALRLTSVPFVSPLDAGVRPDAGEDGTDYPVGAMQLDYLRRLEGELERRESHQDAPYGAIGVFGSDVYDTLMVLKALKPRFPHAVFFTTDLDARFLHERHLPYTRNLVVASHFGLQDEASPIAFRDTYQTSVFRAVRALLGGTDATLGAGPARLFEIGARRAVALNPPALVCSRSRALAQRSSLAAMAHHLVASVQRGLVRMGHRFEVRAAGSGLPLSLAGLLPSLRHAVASLPEDASRLPPPVATWKYWLALASTLILLVALVFFFRPDVDRAATRRGLRLSLLCVFLWLALSVWILDRASRPDRFAHEPLVLLEGVSVWPSVILRLATLFYCLIGVYWTQARMRAGAARIRLDFRLFASPRKVPRGGELIAWLLGRQRAAPVPLEGLWTRMERGLGSPWVWARLFGYAVVLYLVAAPFYMLSAPPPIPVRGQFAYAVERWTLFLSLMAFFMLFAYALELTFLAVHLIRRVADRHGTALPELLLHSHRRTGPDSLGGRHRVLYAGTLGHKLRLDLVREVTREVENLVYVPMLAVCLLILARASLFDAWSWPPVLVVTLLTFFALLLACVVMLRLASREAQDEAVHYVEEQRLRFAHRNLDTKALDVLREQVLALRGGAFSPLSEHPILRTALMPLGALATTLALDSRWLMGLL